MSNKIMVGYGSDTRGSKKKGLYGSRSSGKLMMNGGFNGMPTIDFTNISEDRWIKMFGTENLPKWKRELLEAGESLD
jgi:hypothetical protein